MPKIEAHRSGLFGLSFPTILFLVFLVLKLTDHIDWSWWWVAAPLWFPIVATLGIFIMCVIGALCIGGVAYLFDRR